MSEDLMHIHNIISTVDLWPEKESHVIVFSEEEAFSGKVYLPPGKNEPYIIDKNGMGLPISKFSYWVALDEIMKVANMVFRDES